MKTKQTHTPGPWVTNENESGVMSKTHGFIAYAFPETLAFNQTLDEYKANARLIAAAPDLLKAARDVVNILLAYNRLTGKGTKEIDALFAAIDKTDVK
jgi:hypothetical protein